MVTIIPHEQHHVGIWCSSHHCWIVVHIKGIYAVVL